jgi:hypothetical protein
MLRRQFRKVASSLTGRAHEAEHIKRQRTEQTGGGIRPSISVSLPLAAIAVVTYLSETLDFLNPFYEGMDNIFEHDEDFHISEQNQLFPDLKL